MSFEEKIISGILVGLIVWLITKAIAYFLARERLKAGLVTDIELHIKSIKESKEYLSEWFPTLSAGEEIKYSARHKSDDYVLFHAVLPELPRFFSKEIFTNLLRYYKSIEEYHVLLGGFFADISAWQAEKRKLSDEDISYLSRKLERVTALGSILSRQEINCLSKLPTDYEGKIAAKTIIK